MLPTFTIIFLPQSRYEINYILLMLLLKFGSMDGQNLPVHFAKKKNNEMFHFSLHL